MNARFLTQQGERQHGSVLTIMIIILGVLGIFAIAGFLLFPMYSLQREHHVFEGTLSQRVQSLSQVLLPETPNALQQEISAMLDAMDAQYEPNHIRIQTEEATQTLVLEVWYTRSRNSLLLSNPKQFYTRIEKHDIVVQSPPTPTPAPTPPEVEPTVTPVMLAKATPSSGETLAQPAATPTPVIIRYRPAQSVTDKTFTHEVMYSTTPVMVYFWASWCGYCKKALPLVDQASGRFADQMKIVKLNIDQNPVVKSQWKVRGIPAFLFFKDGELIDRRDGYIGQNTMFGLIRKYL